MQYWCLVFVFMLLSHVAWVHGEESPSGGEVLLEWGPQRHLTATALPDGTLDLQLGEGDPHFWTGVVAASFDPQRHRVVEFEYFAPSGLKGAILRFRRTDGEMVIVGQQPVPPAEAWQPLAFDLAAVPDQPGAGRPDMRFHLALRGEPGTMLQIRRMRVREYNPTERTAVGERQAQQAARQADAEAWLADLRKEFSGRLSRVEVRQEEMRIAGTTPVPATLVAFGPEVPSHRFADSIVKRFPVAAGEFDVVIPRNVETVGSDPLLWRWRLMADASEPLSAARWPTEFDSEASPTLPALGWTHPKGLGGVPPVQDESHEIFQLGIQHATLNIVLTALLQESPGPGREPWEYRGKTYYVHAGMRHQFDRTLQTLHRQQVRVSAILLVGNHRNAQGQPLSQMTHPEAEPRGIYAMPNLATAEGIELYSAVIAFLADRYSQPDSRFGRIQNWILHNEVDQAGTWTNMGDQPLPRYLETCLRSARVVSQLARSRDREARVFLSLTHHWTRQSSGTGTYVVRDLLELFAEAARREGDFPWGVAYHPYPRDLRNPDTWLDREVSDDFDTPYITPKNMEVLVRYLGQERFLYQGQRRGLLLSEQGFNTPTLSEADQRRQVAGLIYMFRKLEQLPEVEAYHLHRYQDMPAGEGGLRLGIIDETGQHKLGWDAYRLIGTENPELRRFEQIADEVFAGSIQTP